MQTQITARAQAGSKSSQETMAKLMSMYGSKIAEAIERIGKFEEVAIIKHEASNRWIMILPDISGEGRWRLQHFDLGGFMGHQVFDTKREAIREAANSIRFPVRDDGALDRIQNTPDFLIGNYRTEQLHRLNRGLIGYSEFKASVADYGRSLQQTAMH